MIQENAFGSPFGGYRDILGSVSTDGGGAVVEPGELSVSIQVQVVYRISY
jgi:hypothetical protein